MKKALTLLILTTGLTYSQTPYWLSGDGYNIYNGNRGNVLLGVRSPFASKLAIDPGNEAYGIALTSDQGQYGNYVQIGVLGRNMDILQGRLLFNLHTSNTDLKFAGYDFRLADKSLFYISGEGNVGIGTITKNPPTARLQIEGGPKWTTDGYNKSLLLGAQDAIGFNGGGYRFGIGATGSSLNFFSTLQETNAQTQRILSLQPNSVTVEGDLIVKGNVISNGQMGQHRQQTNGGGYGPLLGAVGDAWTGVTNGIAYNNGNVGIGTSTPTYKIDVIGRTLFRSDGSISAGAWYGDVNGNAGVFVGQTGVSQTDYFGIFHGGAWRFLVDQNGQVGIGGNPAGGFKLDVSGEFRANKIRFRGEGGNSGQSASYYGIYQETGDWTSPFPDLRIQYHTGIKYDAYYGYGGHRFYTGYDGSGNPAGLAFSVGDGDHNVRVVNNILVGGVVQTANGNDWAELSTVDASSYSQLRFGDDTNDRFRFYFNHWQGTANREIMSLHANGSVNIGTSSHDANYLLAVNGKVKARELYLTVDAGQWSDFVFSKDYKLRSLQEVEQHIKEKGHLPDIPSEKEVVANGVAVVDMQAKLLQKIEELTLYLIEQEKKIGDQQNKIEHLESAIKKLVTNSK